MKGFEKKPQSNRAERGHLSEMVKVGTLAASLFAFDGHPVRAVEIPKTYTWEQGVGEFRRSVFEEPVEYGLTFSVSPEGRVNWLNSHKGETSTVSSAFLESGFEEIVSSKKPIDRICVSHTHPVAAGVKELGLTEEEAKKMSAPPSIDDIYLISPINIQMFGVRNPELKHVKIFNAAFDPRGVWYHRHATKEESPAVEAQVSEEKAKEIQERFNATHEAYTRKSIHQGTDLGPAYETLRADYLNTFGVVVRFASYEELKNEPPCAGPDYKAPR